jgi:hypothetical protein
LALSARQQNLRELTVVIPAHAAVLVCFVTKLLWLLAQITCG